MKNIIKKLLLLQIALMSKAWSPFLPEGVLIHEPNSELGSSVSMESSPGSQSITITPTQREIRKIPNIGREHELAVKEDPFGFEYADAIDKLSGIFRANKDLKEDLFNELKRSLGRSDFSRGYIEVLLTCESTSLEKECQRIIDEIHENTSGEENPLDEIFDKISNTLGEDLFKTLMEEINEYENVNVLGLVLESLFNKMEEISKLPTSEAKNNWIQNYLKKNPKMPEEVVAIQSPGQKNPQTPNPEKGIIEGRLIVYGVNILPVIKTNIKASSANTGNSLDRQNQDTGKQVKVGLTKVDLLKPPLVISSYEKDVKPPIRPTSSPTLSMKGNNVKELAKQLTAPKLLSDLVIEGKTASIRGMANTKSTTLGSSVKLAIRGDNGALAPKFNHFPTPKLLAGERRNLAIVGSAAKINKRN